MGIIDNLKSKLSGNKKSVKQGVDKAADVVDDHVGSHADKVHKAAEMTKDQIDKLPDA